jgi:hypothetical protein
MEGYDHPMKTIEEALVDYPSAVTAWNIEFGEIEVLSVFDVEDGARKVGSLSFPRAERETVTVALQLRGVPVGDHDEIGQVLWVSGTDSFAIWTAEAQVLEVTADEIEVTQGLKLPRHGKLSVEARVEGVELRETSVSLEVDGQRHVLVSRGTTVEGEEALSFDAQWARALGRALSRWLGAPFADKT